MGNGKWTLRVVNDSEFAVLNYGRVDSVLVEIYLIPFARPDVERQGYFYEVRSKRTPPSSPKALH